MCVETCTIQSRLSTHTSSASASAQRRPSVCHQAIPLQASKHSKSNHLSFCYSGIYCTSFARPLLRLAVFLSILLLACCGATHRSIDMKSVTQWHAGHATNPSKTLSQQLPSDPQIREKTQNLMASTNTSTESLDTCGRETRRKDTMTTPTSIGLTLSSSRIRTPSKRYLPEEGASVSLQSPTFKRSRGENSRGTHQKLAPDKETTAHPDEGGARPRGSAARRGGAAHPENAAHPEGVAHPEGAARPEDAVRPEDAAHPEDAVRPEGAARPEGVAHPEGVARPGEGTPHGRGGAAREKAGAGTEGAVQHQGEAKPKESRRKRKEPKGPHLEPEELYEVEACTNHRQRKGRIELLVLWKGYAPEEATWEPLENLSLSETAVLTYMRRLTTLQPDEASFLMEYLPKTIASQMPERGAEATKQKTRACRTKTIVRDEMTEPTTPKKRSKAQHPQSTDQRIAPPPHPPPPVVQETKETTKTSSTRDPSEYELILRIALTDLTPPINQDPPFGRVPSLDELMPEIHAAVAMAHRIPSLPPSLWKPSAEAAWCTYLLKAPAEVIAATQSRDKLTIFNALWNLLLAPSRIIGPFFPEREERGDDPIAAAIRKVRIGQEGKAMKLLASNGIAHTSGDPSPRGAAPQANRAPEAAQAKGRPA